MPAMHDVSPVLENVQTAIRGFRELQRPVVVTEQYPQGLGRTIPPIMAALDPQQAIIAKTTFSCLHDDTCHKTMMALPAKQWVLCGFETHVCILLTAKDLLKAGKEVVVLLDATTSRDERHVAIAADELRHLGIRVTTVESMLFELLGDAKEKAFKAISRLVR